MFITLHYSGALFIQKDHIGPLELMLSLLHIFPKQHDIHLAVTFLSDDLHDPPPLRGAPNGSVAVKKNFQNLKMEEKAKKLNIEFSSNPSSIVAAPNIYDYDFQSNM